MIREILENNGLHISNNKFPKIMNAATKEIKKNRIKHKKMTYLSDLIEVIFGYIKQNYIAEKRLPNGKVK